MIAPKIAPKREEAGCSWIATAGIAEMITIGIGAFFLPPEQLAKFVGIPLAIFNSVAILGMIRNGIKRSYQVK